MELTADDKVDLIHLSNLYGHVLDAFLWEKLDQIFAPDGVFDPSDVGLPIMHGLDEIRAKLIPIEEGPDGDRIHIHVGTNAAIIAVGDDGVVHMRSKYLFSTPQATSINFGEYEDSCIKTPEGWRIKYRKTRRVSSFPPAIGTTTRPGS